MKERMKTVGVALVLCLNFGVDPPDVVKASPCARLECWTDPTSLPTQKVLHAAGLRVLFFDLLFSRDRSHARWTIALQALEAVAKRMQDQYERWQPRARYKHCLDPTESAPARRCARHHTRRCDARAGRTSRVVGTQPAKANEPSLSILGGHLLCWSTT